MGLRLLVYDRTCRGGRLTPGLTHAWWTGAWLYRALGRFDAWTGAGGWDEALAWLAAVRPGTTVDEIQYWGHGRWGQPRVGGTVLDRRDLLRDAPRAPALEAVRRRLSGPEALVWLRTCESFGARAGQAFAAALADRLGARVAGHTFVIGPWQSGLHSLAPGLRPDWPDDEGLAEGTPAAPERARWSAPGQPHTVTCLAGRVPPGW